MQIFPLVFLINRLLSHEFKFLSFFFKKKKQQTKQCYQIIKYIEWYAETTKFQMWPMFNNICFCMWCMLFKTYIWQKLSSLSTSLHKAKVYIKKHIHPIWPLTNIVKAWQQCFPWHIFLSPLTHILSTWPLKILRLGHDVCSS